MSRLNSGSGSGPLLIYGFGHREPSLADRGPSGSECFSVEFIPATALPERRVVIDDPLNASSVAVARCQLQSIKQAVDVAPDW